MVTGRRVQPRVRRLTPVDVRASLGPRRLLPSSGDVGAYRLPATLPASRTTPTAVRLGTRRTVTARWRALLVPGWPLKYMLVGFPLWWVFGLTTLIFPMAAVPMLAYLRRERRTRKLVVPRGTWIWVLYLGWQIASLVMFTQSPPGTHAGSTSGRLVSIGFDFVQYAGITVTLLYVANLRNVTHSAIGRWLGWFFLTVFAGGFLGVLVPNLTFRSVIEYILPAGITTNGFVYALVHPVSAQVQTVLGTEAGRPAAPFGYTNVWGNAISVLLVFFVAAWVLPAHGRKRWIYGGIAVVSAVPIILSLNRGLWIGLIFTGVWLLARMLFQGHAVRVLTSLAGGAVVLVGLALSPLTGIVQARLDNGVSNDIRAFVAEKSIVAIEHSPFLGYGGARHAIGSSSSIAVGPSASCPGCGDVATGSTGQLWAVLFDNGLVGTALYFGFFAYCLWTYRKRRGAMAEAALLSIALTFVYMLFYNSVPVAPTLSMIGVAILYRDEIGFRGSSVPDGREPAYDTEFLTGVPA